MRFSWHIKLALIRLKYGGRCASVSFLYNHHYCNPTEEALAAYEAYDKWKDSYRDAFAKHEAAALRGDDDEAERWWKEFERLFEPRLKWHGLDSIADIQCHKIPTT